MLDTAKNFLSKLNFFSNQSVSEIPQATSSFSRDFQVGGLNSDSFSNDIYAGETMANMFGKKRDFTRIGSIDYYKLRALSRQLFTENMYAAGAIGRMSINVVNSGLRLEANPSQEITGLKDLSHLEWTTKVEELFALWSESKTVSVDEVHDLSGLEKVAYEEAMIEGDILKITEFDTKTKLPRIKLISGRHVQTAINSEKIKAKGNKVLHGVEINKDGKHIAYHVVEDNTFGIKFDAVRILAKGRTSSRETATLIYNSPPPNGLTRGFPLLTRILQPLSQIGRYATLELKAAEVNAAFALWVEKTENVAGTSPFDGPRLKSDAETPPPEDPNAPGKQRVYGGTILNELAFGEKPHSFDTKRPNVNFSGFKKTILEDIAFSIGMPPEVFMLKFENSFSASRQATIEFKSVVMRERNYFSKQFNKDIYGQWLSGMVFSKKIEAKGYILGLKVSDVFVVKGWQKARFIGFIKQNVDILKEAKAYKEYIDEGLMDRDQAASELTGTDFATNVKRLKKQNLLLADARDPLIGEINTSISRVEKDEVKDKKQNREVKEPVEVKEKKSEASLDELDSVDVDVNSVDFDVDKMDIEEGLEV